jgi:hypothetical protein
MPFIPLVHPNGTAHQRSTCSIYGIFIELYDEGLKTFIKGQGILRFLSSSN